MTDTQPPTSPEPPSPEPIAPGLSAGGPFGERRTASRVSDLLALAQQVADNAAGLRHHAAEMAQFRAWQQRVETWQARIDGHLTVQDGQQQAILAAVASIKVSVDEVKTAVSVAAAKADATHTLVQEVIVEQQAVAPREARINDWAETRMAAEADDPQMWTNLGTLARYAPQVAALAQGVVEHNKRMGSMTDAMRELSRGAATAAIVTVMTIVGGLFLQYVQAPHPAGQLLAIAALCAGIVTVVLYVFVRWGWRRGSADTSLARKETP